LVKIFEWLKYVSPLKYSMELILLTEFEDVFMGNDILTIWGYDGDKKTCRVILSIMVFAGLILAYGQFWRKLR
jgi:hypothetical protein